MTSRLPVPAEVGALMIGNATYTGRHRSPAERPDHNNMGWPGPVSSCGECQSVTYRPRHAAPEPSTVDRKGGRTMTTANTPDPIAVQLRAARQHRGLSLQRFEDKTGLLATLRELLADDDHQTCSRCGDRVYTLSSDGLCDGCVEAQAGAR